MPEMSGSDDVVDSPVDWVAKHVAQYVETEGRRGHRFYGRARPATPEERPRLRATMTGVWPAYEGYRKRTRREIPVVVIDVGPGGAGSGS